MQLAVARELIELPALAIAGIASGGFSAYNLIKENWDGIDRWTTDNIFKPLQDMQFGRWVKGWFKIRGRSVAPVEYHNYTGLNSDPLAGASATIPPSFFGGSGTSAGGLGIFGRYYGALWSHFKNRLSSSGDAIANFVSHPLDSIGMAWDNHWEMVSNPLAFANSLDRTLASYNPIHQFVRNATISLSSNDPISTFGGLNGEALADKTVEAGTMAVGGVGGKLLSRGFGVVRGASANTFKGVRSALASRTGKRGFSEVGYQFQKHWGRGNPTWGSNIPTGARLNPGTFNQAGYNTFKQIWRSPGKFNRVGGFIEKRLPDGRGIRFQENWQFKGFLD